MAAVNNEGELPVDLCDEAIDVRDLLRHEIAVQGERASRAPGAGRRLGRSGMWGH